jgi:putative oligomerization/nucleic acid binding protein
MARPPRRRAVTALLVAGAILLFFTAFASWVNRQALDTDEWTKTSSELLENEEIRNALATYLVDQLYANVDVTAELRRALPPQAQGLAGPAAGGLREFADRAARRALQGPRVQALWENLNRNAHEQFVRIVKDEGGGGAVSTQGGDVTLQLTPLVQQIATRVGLGGLADKVPPDAGELTVMKSDQLDLAQDVADAIQTIVIVLLVLTLGCYVLAVYLARGRRREALRGVGLTLIITGIVILVVRSIAGGVVVNELATTASVEPAVQQVWNIGTSLWSDIAGGLIINGIILVIVAWVAGPTRPAVALRREAAPYMRERPELIYALVALIFVLMIAWGPTRAFREAIPLLVVAGLLILGTEALRRQTAREFPDATLDESASLRERLARMRSSASGATGSARASLAGRRGAAPAPEEARIDQLERLAALRDRGAISQEEFDRQKTQLLR